MRPEGTPLDLNNLPEEYGSDRYREGKQISEESSTTATAEATDASCRKKRSGKEGKECGKIYECRFCSLKFCKSQALGGHMNRHRQERETETLNRARQLVFNNENLGGQGHFVGCNIPSMPTANFNQRGPMGDPSLSFRPVYTRLPSPSSPSILPQPPPLQPHLCPSSPRLLSFPSPYPPPPMNDYFIGHVLNLNRPMNPSYSRESSYTCIGAPVATHSFPTEGVRASPPEGLRFNQADGLNWNFGNAEGPDLDGSSMDRFRSEY